MENRKMKNSGKGVTVNRRCSIRERKMALQQDVDKLTKRLRHEENVHRALERAFTRPLGSLPRLPSYLPPYTVELLAEVAVLEEEVIRLEEKLVLFRQGLYEEAVCISSSRNMEHLADLGGPLKVKSSTQTEETCIAHSRNNPPPVSDEKRRGETHSNTILLKTKQQTPIPKRQMVPGPVTKPLVDGRLAHEKLQMDSAESKNACLQEKKHLTIETPNQISESILKCLVNIFLRMSSKRSRSTAEALPSSFILCSSENVACTDFRDPYGICSKFGKRDIGPYKHLLSIEAGWIKTDQKAKYVHRLTHLLGKLGLVKLKGLSHQEKLAFWINIYNACMMKAFLEHGIPETPELMVSLMQKATVNVGGCYLNAVTIEHFILRLPYHSKYTFSTGMQSGEASVDQLFGLEFSEPLVTFAISCGSWSSPAVRVYTASQVENELETAKRDYLQAAIGFSVDKKLLAIPKLLDWYLADFAKDMDSLLDWICLELPCEAGKEAMKCLETRTQDTLQILPYDFSFRYLFIT